MSIRLIAMDMDDTLLNENHQISPATKKAIQLAINRGVAVTIATGRMFCSTLPFARDLGINAPLINYNGAMVRDTVSGKTLFHRPIERETAVAVASFFRERGWYLQKHINDLLYVVEMDENVVYYADYARVEAIPLGNDFYSMPEAPTKLLSLADQPLLDEIKAETEKRWGDHLCLASSRTRYLEMVDVVVNKGEALAFLAGSLGIAQSEVMAIGDGMNDVAMIEYAGCGVAMGNAKAAVQAAADYVTLDNSQDGVAAAIEKFVLK